MCLCMGMCYCNEDTEKPEWYQEPGSKCPECGKINNEDGYKKLREVSKSDKKELKRLNSQLSKMEEENKRLRGVLKEISNHQHICECDIVAKQAIAGKG